MKPLPSDYKILKEIYERYFDEFSNFSNGGRSNKIHMPIDIDMIAKDLNVDPDMIFGRLYYSLEKKYGYKTGENTRVCLFSPKVGEDANAVNFPLLASVFSGMKEERSRSNWALGMSFAAIIISIIAMLNNGS